MSTMSTPEEKKSTTPSIQEAREIATRFINRHFGNAGEEPRASIPADPMRDDDIRLMAFIGSVSTLRLAGVAAIEAASKYAAAGMYEEADLVKQEFGREGTIKEFEAMRSRLTAQTEELRQAKEDNERLDWLEKQASPAFFMDYEGPEVKLEVDYGNINDMGRKQLSEATSIRAAIDAARAVTPQGNGGAK